MVDIYTRFAMGAQKGAQLDTLGCGEVVGYDKPGKLPHLPRLVGNWSSDLGQLIE